jgi:phage tail-like protein
MRRSELALLLPTVFQEALAEDHLLAGFLDAMEGLHAPSEAILGGLDAAFDPLRAPASFVPFLARWVDLERLFTDGGQPLPSHPLLTSHLGRLRELVASAADLAGRRGTAAGLIDFLRTATGLDDFSIIENPPGTDGAPIPFHIRVAAPAAAESLRPVIERIVEQEKPAHVTWELAIEVAA